MRTHYLEKKQLKSEILQTNRFKSKKLGAFSKNLKNILDKNKFPQKVFVHLKVKNNLNFLKKRKIHEF